MPRKPRAWYALDIEISKFFTQLREEIGESASYRQIAAKTGLTHIRVRDILVGEKGVPTLDDFILLCKAFNLDPASTLELLMQRAGMSDAATPSSVEDSTSPALADRDDYKLVANEDENKSIEMYDYYD